MELVKAEDYGIEKNKYEEMQAGLQLTLSERDLLRKEFEVVSKLEVTEANKSKFRALRLKWSKNRTQGVNEWHKKGKAVSLAIGKLYDAKKNELNREGEANEKVLLDAENHLENLEKERLEKLQFDRINLVTDYVEDAHLIDLSGMAADVWNAYFSTKKKAFEDKVKSEKEAAEKEAAEAKAEKERLEAIEKENDKLKAAAEAKEKELEKERMERAKVEAARIAAEVIEKSKIESKLKAAEKERERLAKIESDKQEAILNKEREEKEKLAAELQAKKDAEIKAEKERLEAEQSELKKGDSDKVKDLISSLVGLKSKYSFKSKKHQKMYNDVQQLIDKVVSHIDL